MPAALTSEIALAYLRELSADIRAAVLLDAQAQPLARDAALAEPARELLAGAPPGAELHAPGDAHVFAARDDRHQLVVVTGPFALARVCRHDLRTVLGALGGGARTGVPIAPSPGAVTALIRAVHGS